MEKFTKTNAEKYIKTSSDAQVAQLGHLNAIIENLSTLNYKVYTSLIEQDSNATAPTTIVELENKVGSISWTRSSAGNYQCVLPTGVPINKMFVLVGNQYFDGTTATPILDNSNILVGYVIIYPVQIGGIVNSIKLETVNTSGAYIEMGLLPLQRLYFEFRIYN
jgi:hypothetical protein